MRGAGWLVLVLSVTLAGGCKGVLKKDAMFVFGDINEGEWLDHDVWETREPAKKKTGKQVDPASLREVKDSKKDNLVLDRWRDEIY
jgi:hypothetical protein